MPEQELPEEVVAPLLATAAAVVMYLAVNDDVYKDFVRWSRENVVGPPGFPKPKPPSQKVLVLGAAILVQMASSNMTPDQASYLAFAKIIAEGGLN